ncbi:UNVERIFIED_CONTAM: Ubiquitin carboxyl-terminal hydrolase 16 [Sesamum calycinum]|uniref:Ubiquitin carboxyl-terminal hydrolase 16 n=1 Tax=Sesamum calycinum TaxID=2727403 RepID=A0AAW2P864_9LAMI
MICRLSEVLMLICLLVAILGSMPFRKLLSVEKKWIHRGASCLLENSSYLRNASSETKPSARRVVDQLRSSTFTRPGSLSAGSGNMRRDECLAFTPPLPAYFIEGIHSKACEKKGWCFTCEFEKLVKKAKEGNSPLSPVSIMSQMQCIGSHMGNGREEDAHEFLRYAIDAMQSVCLKEAGVKMPSSLDEETTLMGLTFGGYLRSKIECMRCGGNSEQHERIMDLTVEIGEILELWKMPYVNSLALRWQICNLTDDISLHLCTPFRCKSYEKAKKKLRVSEAPNILTIALKRFQVQSVELKKVLLEDAYLLLYSRGVSCSTESTNRESTSTDDNFDQILVTEETVGLDVRETQNLKHHHHRPLHPLACEQLSNYRFGQLFTCCK